MEGNINEIEIDQGQANPNVVKFLEREEEIKKCPNCNSIYITDDECESCKYQLKYDRLGGINSPRGFLELRDEYFDGLYEIQKWLPFLERKKTTRLNRLSRLAFFRSEDIFRWFDEGDNLFKNPEMVKLYLWELNEIIEFVSHYPIYNSRFKKHLNSLKEKQYPFYDEILESYQNKQNSKLSLGRFFSLRIGIGPRVGFLFILLIFIGLLSALAVTTYSLDF